MVHTGFNWFSGQSPDGPCESQAQKTLADCVVQENEVLESLLRY